MTPHVGVIRGAKDMGLMAFFGPNIPKTSYFFKHVHTKVDQMKDKL